MSGKGWRRWSGTPTADDLAAIESLRAKHPVESCDLFRTVTGRCTCSTPDVSATPLAPLTPNETREDT